MKKASVIEKIRQEGKVSRLSDEYFVRDRGIEYTGCLLPDGVVAYALIINPNTDPSEPAYHFFLIPPGSGFKWSHEVTKEKYRTATEASGVMKG